MKSYLKLYIPLTLVLLIAIVLVGKAFFSTRKQPTTKTQDKVTTQATSPATETTASAKPASPATETKPSAPLPESPSVPARRQADAKKHKAPAQPEVLEAKIPESDGDDDVAESRSEGRRENRPRAFSGAKELRKRALQGQDNQETAPQTIELSDVEKVTNRKPIELRLKRAGKSFDGDLRNLPYEKSVEREMPEHEDPYIVRRLIGKPGAEGSQANTQSSIAFPNAPLAPPPINVFEGLDRFGFGAGSPPDTNGDVGPNNYIQTVNTSIGIYNKTTGVRDVGVTFNTFMSQGNFGNLCDTNNFGDPVVLYDTFEDRWIITDFAFLTDVGGNVVAPAFQCFAASKTPDPIAGGWNFYSIQLTDALNDYPKFGIWPDGLYMSSNLFGFGAGGTFQGVRVWAFNKAQMYAGAPSVQSVSFNVGGGDFTVIPSNARLQTGTPPAGRPNLFLSTQLFLNALTIYKFHVDWDRISLTTFTGPDIPIAATSWPSAPANAAQPGTATLLDVLAVRAMVQNQYTNFAGVESLWAPHTVRRAAGGLAAPRWYQVDVTGGTVGANLPQATTWDPDGAANVINRFMPSLALDRAGNMALGYSTSNGTTEFPSIKYAGRLSTDPVNTFSQTEQVFFAGTGSQTGSTRWGDYSSMTLDPNGCTFWYTTEYANPLDQTSNHRWLTKWGSFQFSPCTTIGNGTLQGTVTTSPGGTPINGATVAFGARTTTTNISGFYSFPAIPAGTYLTETASKAGFDSSTTTNIVVADGGTTVKDFALPSAPLNGCLTDTAQPDFQLGVFTNLDVNTTPGDVTLLNAPTIDQQNTAGTTTGTGFGTPNWTGQTFIPAVTGNLAKVDVQLFCANGVNPCTGPAGNLTLSVRNTAAGVPTGADLATATIPGFTSNAGGTFTATFASPPALTSGTQYALVLRPVSNPAVGSYFWIRSSPSTYANGQRVTSTDSGGTWATDVTRDFNFKAYMQTGFAASGDIVSGLKDSNPTPPQFARWNTLAWTATLPANTTLRFQIAGSNNPGGPFNFIGPDGTAATFFTSSPASIYNLVNGNRYLKYKAFFTSTNGAVTPTVSDVTVCFNQGPTAEPGDISGVITTADGSPLAGVTMNLSGARSAETITDSSGHYRFTNNDPNTSYMVTPSLVNYHFSPASRSFSLLGSTTDAVFTATRDAVISGNAIDTTEYFVRQQYLDFLGREPDEAGLAFWSNEINSCGGNAQCKQEKRIDVSAAFFLSIENQETSYLVYRMYKAAYGNLPNNAPVPVALADLGPDARSIADGVVVNQNGWQAKLSANQQTFAEAFVARSRFSAAYPTSMTPSAFVDQLFANAGIVADANDRAEAISEFGATTNTSDTGARARALRRVADSSALVRQEFNKAFVLMQYFGYLGRDANGPPDGNYGGYNFWLTKLNAFGGDYRAAQMVEAFITSGEYRRRFENR